MNELSGKEVHDMKSLPVSGSKTVAGRSNNRRSGDGEAETVEKIQMINQVSSSHYPYRGPLGEVFRYGISFVASKNGFPLRTCNSFDEAMALLAWRGRVKACGYRVAP